MTDWKQVAHHYRRLLRAEVAVSKRISLAGIAVTRELQETRKQLEEARNHRQWLKDKSEELGHEIAEMVRPKVMAALREQESQTMTTT